MEGRPMNSTEIINALQQHGITAYRRAIYRDIREIDRIVPIKSTRGPRGGFMLWDVIAEAEGASE